MKVRRGYLKTADGLVHYRAAGTDGDRVMLLHQTPLSSDVFTEVMERLAESYQVVAIDTPGYGDSDPTPFQYTIGDYAVAVIRALDALGWEQASLVGRLTGSALAAEAAARAPGRIESLVLSAMPEYDDDERTTKLAGLRPTVLRPDGGQARIVWDAMAAGNPTLPADQLHRIVVSLLKAGSRNEMAHHAVFSYDAKPRLPFIQCPTLLLYTESDRFLPRAERVGALLRRHKVQVIPGGQMVVLEDPGAFADAVSTFLRSPGI